VVSQHLWSTSSSIEQRAGDLRRLGRAGLRHLAAAMAWFMAGSTNVS
jgi:hypothetical protein